MTDTIATHSNAERLNLSERPFLLINIIERPARLRRDYEHDVARLHTTMRAEAIKEAEETGTPYDAKATHDAIRAAIAKLDKPTPTYLKAAPSNDPKAKAVATRAAARRAAAFTNSLRIAPVDKQPGRSAKVEPIVTSKATRKGKFRPTRPALVSYEQTAIVDRIKSAHLINAAVIIDVLRGDLIKHNLTQGIDENQVVEHYLSKYMDDCKAGIDRYLTKMAQKHIRENGDVQAIQNRIEAGEDIVVPAIETRPSREAVRRKRNMDRLAAKAAN